MGVADIVAEDHLSAEQRAERGSYVGCIAGALSISEFRAGLEAAGLTDVSVIPTHAVADGMLSAIVQARKLVDATPPPAAPGVRPELTVASESCCGGACC